MVVYAQFKSVIAGHIRAWWAASSRLILQRTATKTYIGVFLIFEGFIHCLISAYYWINYVTYGPVNMVIWCYWNFSLT
jgi:hypothetical protein